MAPHSSSSVYGIGAKIPFNLIVAVVAIIGVLLSSERKLPPSTTVVWLIVVFGIWATISTALSSTPDISMEIWDRLYKSLLLSLLLAGMMQSKIRIHAAIWVIAISLGFYGFSGGLYWILSGGSYQFSGPRGTIIQDNNHLALALVVSLPIINYLRIHSGSRLTKIAVTSVMVATFLAILGTYSRGGAIGLISVIGIYFLTSRKKVRNVAVGAIVLLSIVIAAPDTWLNRMETIGSTQSDNSLSLRMESWKYHFEVAKDHPIFGAGFWATQQPAFASQYAVVTKRALAAHSIYFQSMADLGFVGLAIFLSIWFFTWRNLTETMSRTAGLASMRWAHDLASMMRLSLVGYAVSGAALSMAYYDLMYILAALGVALRAVCGAGHPSPLVQADR